MTAVLDMPAESRRMASPTGYVVSPPEMQTEHRGDWLAQRREGIGSSDIAAICGLDKYTSPLGIYHEKRGEFEMPRNPRLDATARFGLFVEPYITAEFAEATGYEAIPHPGTLAHVERPWMRASMDRLLINPRMRHRGPLGPLELKSRSAYQSADWVNEPPPGPFLQTQWQLGVTGYDFGYIAAMIGNGLVLCFRVDRDDKLIGNLVRIAEEFWQHVQDGIPPKPDGSQALANLLGVRWQPADADPEPLIVNPIEVDRWLTQREQAKAAIEAADALLTEAENHLKTIAGPHEVVKALGETVFTWKWVKRTDIDRAAMREDGVYEQYAHTSRVRRFEVPRGKK